MSVEKLRRQVALDLRVKSATPEQLEALRDFFDAPMLREHYRALYDHICGELGQRAKTGRR